MVMTALLLGGVLGCGNECDRALDKLENECHFNEDSKGGVEQCEEFTECYARCLNEVSCEEIAYPELDGPLNRCIQECPRSF